VYLAYSKATIEEKRELFDATTSKIVVDGKAALIMLRFPFQPLQNAEDPRMVAHPQVRIGDLRSSCGV
jgi:hypothetical protein